MSGRITRTVLLVVVAVIAPLVLGTVLAPRLVPKPQVGIIYFWSDIYPMTAWVATEQMKTARENPDIKAVVLMVNSPGGEVTSSEDLYYSVLYTREEMPVVVSVDWMAASGAYYLAVAADEIYAKPTSLVGNIGVIGYAATPPYVDEELITTGPYKAFGGTQAGQVQQMETAKEGFLAAVAAGRGDRLQVGLDFLSRGEIFTGVQAYEMGMIDGLRSSDEAVARAAELAGLRDYDVVDLYAATFQETDSTSASSGELQWRSVDELPPGLYYRYVELSR